MCVCMGGGGGGLQVFPAISVIIALVIHTILHNYETISFSCLDSINFYKI